MVIATGTSTRHVATMAEHLRQRLKAAGHAAPRIEGLPHADWVLVDAGDVVVHVFRPEVRSFYNLEKMWGRGLPAAVDAAPTLPGRRGRATLVAMA
jgi:ribosome-associated protein